MKRTKQILVITLMAALVALAFSACGSFDPAAYVKAHLDILYHGEVNEEQTELFGDGSTVEDFQKDFEDGIDTEAEIIITNLGAESASTESIEKLREAIISVNKATKYEVGEATENGDNYDVAVTVYPLDIYNQTINSDDYLTKISEECSSGNISDEEFYSAAVERIAADLTAAAEDPQYEDAEEVTVSVILDSDGFYTVSEDSASDIYNKLMNFFTL